MNKASTFFGTVKLITLFYVKNAPLKFVWETLLLSIKHVMTVVTSVWLLKHLTEMLICQSGFWEMIIPLGIVTALNVVIDLIEKYYSNCLKPLQDLKLSKRFDDIILNHAKELPLK